MTRPLAILLLLVYCSISIDSFAINTRDCGRSLQWKSGDRIVGGRPALAGEFPWQVSIRRYAYFAGGFVHICGGSIISEQWILTAGHCVYGVPELEVGVFSNITNLNTENGQATLSEAEEIIVHPGYDEDTSANDIALIKLTKSLELNSVSVGKVCLPIQDDESMDENFLTVSGWGATSEEGDYSTSLLAVELPLVDFNSCNATYNGTLRDDVLCAGWKEGGKDSCQGDSGGPLIYRDARGIATQSGIVSYGEGCARQGIPGIYTRVSFYRNWILGNNVTIGKASPSLPTI